MRILFKPPLRSCRIAVFIWNTMSIRNATIARRRRKISLSEQEHMTLKEALRRAGRSGQSKRQDDRLPLKKADKAASWHANWAEW
ncbi:hypothetical protein GCM10010981_39500 [Dyella nitratireducens]|uniref:Uncharacterized protein n=2 Tax=Dyella nitratireducens TaxID=1849580 RepID=A0ABQ1GMM9_9GAMM|nr:hypothetical protein GCM10010981_39500 [Dyella nitratireducens]GLQ41452.1 hypothetical protein GCM10007902_13020 [Dyella nitratireducens]